MAEIDELKAAFEQHIQTLNTHNLDAFVATVHNGVTGFTIASPFPVDGQEVIRQFVQTVIANTESNTFMPINPQFRVIGTTGVVWSHHAVARKPKDGPRTTVFGRSTFTFVKTDGQWLCVSFHHSLIPSGS
jgi:ketosteroid isomerase-like protein